MIQNNRSKFFHIGLKEYPSHFSEWMTKLVKHVLMLLDSTLEEHQLFETLASTLKSSYSRNSGRAGLGFPHTQYALCITHCPFLYLKGNSGVKKIFISIGIWHTCCD